MLTNTSYVGSIGVVMRHVDFSRALANDGIHVTSIFAGAHKVDGNPYEPLPASVRAALQADINGLYTMFVQAVSRHLGMAEAAVRATQAQTYMGEAAIAAGLARRISTTDALIAELAAQRTRIHPTTNHPPSKANAMSIPGTPQAVQPTAPAASTTPTAPAAGFTQVDLDKARAEAATAERTRVSAILGHPAAATHPALAQQCIATGLSAEQAGGILGALPQAAAPVPPKAADSQFAQAMQALGNPNVSGVEASGAAPDENDPTMIQNSWASAFGTTQKKH